MSGRQQRMKLGFIPPGGGCAGKQDFKSFSAAKEAASRRDGRGAYKCPFCHGYHIGSHDHGDYRNRLRIWKRKKQELKNGDQ